MIGQIDLNHHVVASRVLVFGHVNYLKFDFDHVVTYVGYSAFGLVVAVRVVLMDRIGSLGN